MRTRREFLGGSMAASVFLARGARSWAGESRSALADDPLRPQFHLMPPRGWMNDPNGPIVWNGQVHLFYQVNPHGGANWADISWGHAVSSDMLHWRHLPVALMPEAGYADSYGVFSGSCVADGGRCLAFYTAVEKPENPASATIHDPDKQLQEQQVVAISNDPELKHWVRQKRVLIAKPPLQPTAGFRDPCLWREGNTWYMILGSGVRDQYGAVLLYRATVATGEKANWEYLHPLVTGRTTEVKMPGAMWECPDFFELDGHHVLLYSADGKQFWVTGTLDRASLSFKPKKQGLVDSGAYYAAKSMIGPQGERVLWGWIRETRPSEQSMAAGWSGAMSLPRILHVTGEGDLRASVAPVFDKLLEPIGQTSTADLSVPSLAAKVSAMLPADGAGVTVQAGEAMLFKMRRVSEDQLELSEKLIPASLAEGVTAFIDGSVVELFFGDAARHTLRCYPKLDSEAGLVFSANGGARITVQAVSPISADRLTT